MSETIRTEEEQQETPSELKRVKKGLSLSHVTAALLEAKAKEVSKNQSDVADEVLAFGIPAYDTETGMRDLQIMVTHEVEELREAMRPVNAKAGVDIVDSIPEVEEVVTTRGRREKLRVHGMNQLPGGQQIMGKGDPGEAILADQPDDGLYRPGMGQGVGPLPTQQVQQGPQQGLSQQELDYIVARVTAAQNMIQEPYPAVQPVQPAGMPPGPVDMNPYSQQPPVQPAQPVQFAASYPPGYTGSPGVAGVAPQPVEAQGIYPYPGTEGQRRQPQIQPPHMNDPYAMNIANQVGGQGQPLTAQGLLSGGAAMTPNVQQRNINMDMARVGLGHNWRDNLHSMTAANRKA